MRPCVLKIVTSVDGEESVFSTDAEMELTALSALLRYTQDEGDVLLRLRDGDVSLVRTGDYALSLHFVEGKVTEGMLGIGGAKGTVETLTRAVVYAFGRNSLHLNLQYALRMSGASQEMELTLTAQGKNLSEEQ